MNLKYLKYLKLKWKLGKMLCAVGVAFWLIETVYFLIAYGWHWEAINNAEKTCDTIAVGFWCGGFMFIGIVVIDVIEYLLSSTEED
jgi:hypothetical protein